jgi:hypothetical protein
MLAVAVVIACWCVATAQQQEPSLKPTGSPKAPTVPTRLLLEVTYNRSLPPGYSTVNGSEEDPKWIWVTRFIRIPGRQLPAGKLPIVAVRLEAVFNGETADVKVTLLRGNKGFEQEDLVGVYQLGVGEQKTLTDLDQHGIEPFNIALINTVPPLPPPPSFDNLTKAIEVVSVEMENMPKPAYKLTLRNVSEKSVRAVKIQLTTDGRVGETTMFQGQDGRAFLEPGEVEERKIPVIRGVPAATGYVVGSATATVIGIRTAVFSDLSFEGDPVAACMFESLAMSQRAWLKQIVSLIDQEVDKSNGDHVEAAKQFKGKVGALTFDFDESERNKESAVSPTCAKPAISAAMLVNSYRLDLLRELDKIINNRPAPPVNFKSWLEEKRARYSAWLGRL